MGDVINKWMCVFSRFQGRGGPRGGGFGGRGGYDGGYGGGYGRGGYGGGYGGPGPQGMLFIIGFHRLMAKLISRLGTNYQLPVFPENVVGHSEIDNSWLFGAAANHKTLARLILYHNITHLPLKLL